MLDAENLRALVQQRVQDWKYVVPVPSVSFLVLVLFNGVKVWHHVGK